MGALDRAHQAGWIKIGKTCSAKRRSLWMRVMYKGDEAVKLELCAGREGDDSYLCVLRGEPLFLGLLQVMEDARFAAET